MYDLIIIGAGPAGITASVYAARKKINFIVITKDIGGQAAWSADIENYTGYQFITGPELVSKFEEHMLKTETNVKENETVLNIEKKSNTITVQTDKNTYETKTLIIASGKKSRELGVPGEIKFKNKGLTYCATCDGPLFADKDVAVIGGGNSALDAALQLIKIARKTYLINTAPVLSADPVMIEKLKSDKSVRILNDYKVAEIIGDKFVNAIKIKNTKTQKEEIINVEGVFVEIGLIATSDFAGGLKKNSFGEIEVNSQNETNIPGIFAAGDVTNVPEKQIIIAAGEGSKATLSAFRYLSQNKF